MSPLARLRAVFAGDGGPPIAPRARLIGGLIALVAAATGFLAVASAEIGLAAHRVAGAWSGELDGAATVRLPPAEATAQAAAVAAALEALSQTPGVAAARPLSEEERRALLAPWLGPDADLSALPAPALIDVRLEGAGPDAEDLARRLDLVAPGAVYDDHGAWRAPLDDAARNLRAAAVVASALAAAALAAMVAVATAATLWSAAGVVRTLRLIGAEDRFIMRVFERPFALRAALGAFVGAGAALALAAALVPAAGAEAAFTGAGEAGPFWPSLAAAPLVAGATALLAARAAAFLLLRRE
ncbi:MAG: cell division protein FtsX [Pseudomonadota bacterium]